MMMKYIRPWLLTGALLLAGGEALANPFAADTLKREMVLQREYQPVGQEAEKVFFNPLEGSVPKKLKPIRFARNTYAIAMNVTPKLFEPLDNPLAPEAVKQKFHARLFGGYPGIGGAELAFLTKTSEAGTLMLSADHLSRYVRGEYSSIGIKKIDETHDTRIGINYNHALEERTVGGGVELFHHANTFYGLFSPRKEPFASLLDATYPMYQMGGAEINFSLSPAPIALASRWQYAVRGKVSYTGKDNASMLYEQNRLVLPLGEERTKPEKVSELGLDLVANLDYKFAGSDWGFGVDGRYQLIAISALHTLLDVHSPMQQISLAPHVGYSAPNLHLSAGAKVQFVNRGSRKLLVVPDVEFRYRAHELFSLYLLADGGARFHGIRELYKENRWLSAEAVYNGFDIAQYRALVGVQLGNINGFSIDVNGGYTHFSDFSDWDYSLYNTTFMASNSSQQEGLFTPLFTKVNRGGVGQVFVKAEARYLSPIGLDLGAKVKVNRYQSTLEEKPTVGFGLPTMELGIDANYLLMDKLTLHVDFQALTGIKYLVPQIDNVEGVVTKSKVEDHYNCLNLGARITYDAHRNVGVSIIGQNLLHQKQSRWLGYERQGITGMLALTLKF